jgi:hypothetical protein
MNKPTFKEQSEKIIQAYLKCGIEPMNPRGCFVGNLLNNTKEWRKGIGFVYGTTTADVTLKLEAMRSISKESKNLYSLQEIADIENNFMTIVTGHWSHMGSDYSEDELFEAMISTLELLKQIHILKGEVIEEEIVLQKRELA